MAIYIGTSGWSYDHWQGVLYPQGASSLQRLDAYVRRFRTVEVNNTFYRWPKEETFTNWRTHLPDGFLMSVKASRGLTQFRRLNDPGPWLNRMTEGLRRLEDHRGILLVQLPPRFAHHQERLANFLNEVPEGLTLAIEFRHPSWNREDVFALLEQHHVAYCVMSGAGLPCILRATAREVYVRLHGPDNHHLYAGSYNNDNLRWWADRAREWSDQGHDVFLYFNNDGYGHAVRNAETLQEMLGVGPSGS